MKHNRKYKLLKDLPDGAIVGDIYVDNGYGKYTNQRMDASKSPVIEHNSYFSWQVETSTDFFEEVNTVEKGYQDLIEKCKNSPYFFATNYLTINGKPFSTMLSEEEFNKQFLSLSNPEPSSKKEERDWEILSCKCEQSIHPYQPDVCLGKDKSVKLCEIYSVLRKADNTIFTVGEETTIGVIKKFELKEELMYWWNEHTWYYFSQATKLPSNTAEDKPFVWTDEL
ncbi:MAG: hypothetical protein KBA90_13190, partial [Chitinophagaceae bacterium]|nr:hypothetical protein [Chitinophagaceae bacterium]